MWRSRLGANRTTGVYLNHAGFVSQACDLSPSTHSASRDNQGANSTMDPVLGLPDADSLTPVDLTDPVADPSLPTHHLQNIKAGHHSVQLLVSTKDHLYEANDVEAGEDSWQVIGSWGDASVSELTQILSQRSTTQQPSASSSAQSRFGGGYGAGKTLGKISKQTSDAEK